MAATEVQRNIETIKETATVLNFNNASLSIKCFLYYKINPKTRREG